MSLEALPAISTCAGNLLSCFLLYRQIHYIRVPRKIKMICKKIKAPYNGCPYAKYMATSFLTLALPYYYYTQTKIKCNIQNKNLINYNFSHTSSFFRPIIDNALSAIFFLHLNIILQQNLTITLFISSVFPNNLKIFITSK